MRYLCKLLATVLLLSVTMNSLFKLLKHPCVLHKMFQTKKIETISLHIIINVYNIQFVKEWVKYNVQA